MLAGVHATPVSCSRAAVHRDGRRLPRRRTGRSSSVPSATASTADRRSPRRGAPRGRASSGARPSAQGFSGPVVVQGRVILFHRIGNEEIVDAIDARTGAAQWRYAYPTTYRDDFGFDEGPRAVPVVADGIVYTFGAEGQLHAIDLAKGTRLWSDDTMQRFDVPKGFFGAAGSPLVEDGRVLANVGGPKAGIVAFDAKTGKVLWTATDAGASYSSPVGATIAGRRHAIFLTRAGLVGLDPATGPGAVSAAVARADGRVGQRRHAPRRRRSDFRVGASTGPAPGAAPRGFDAHALWTSDEALSNHYATSVHRDGFLYGFHGRQEFGQSFRAVELRTGKVRWSQDRFRAGTVTLAGDRLVILRETGELILAAASPDGFKPLARAQILPGTVRAYPALSDGFLFARNDNTLICAGPADNDGRRCSIAVLPCCRRRSSRSSRRPFSIARSRISRPAASPSPPRDSTRSSKLVPSAGAAALAARHRAVLRRPVSTTAARSSSRTAPSTRTTSRMPRGIFSASRARSRPTKAKAALLPVGPDSRVPMRQVYEMFRGTHVARQVLKAAGSRDSAQFYAHLYVGLYFDALRDTGGRSSTSRWRPPIGTPTRAATCTPSRRSISGSCSGDELAAVNRLRARS